MKKHNDLMLRQLVLIVADLISIMCASFIAFYINDLQFSSYPFGLLILVTYLISFVVFCLFHLYRSLWEYASVNELIRVFVAVFLSSLAHGSVALFFHISDFFKVQIIYFLMLFCLIFISRFFYRGVRLLRKYFVIDQKNNYKKVMIVGAGSAGDKLFREILNTPKLAKKVVCFIDDDPNKKNRYLQNVPVVGNRHDIVAMAEKYQVDEIYIALPSIDEQSKTAIIQIANETNCKVLKLPGMYQFINGEKMMSQFKQVEIEDLLGRKPIVINDKEIASYVRDKVVMVTGGGGSIGSELCRQIAKQLPKTLIIVDIYENNAYDIQQELRRKYPTLDLEVMIASVRDESKINELFNRFRPNIVYHAAAHKHVPLMEDSPHEAIKNNVFGTYHVVKACDRYKVERMILISTDKAVNPTNIMGASKRLCEMIVQSYNKRSRTEFVAVRFGNVLGSNGSVIPLFKQQIAQGGPVTVTHPDIIRYFMTIPEAVSLVLQAGAYANGGEIFILDMGEPVKIVDMARNLIRLSGLKPDIDIQIKFTGLRPGEKLYEEKLMKEEGLQKTSNQLIHIAKPIELDEEVFFKKLDHLNLACHDEHSDIRTIVKDMVPTYKEEKK